MSSRRYTDSESRKILAARDAGMSVAEVAKMFERSPAAIIDHCARATRKAVIAARRARRAA